ncbi:hypothetical protein BI330_19525 [Mycobacterium sp. CBMA 623]|nr:hypothetical protein [Mycobacteroides sp. CBMA 326]
MHVHHGQGSAVIQDGQLETGYFVGCRTDSSADMETGGDSGLTLNQSVSGQGYGGGYGEADGCGGQVKIQSYATFRIRTENGNDTQTVYGEPKDL